METVTVCGDGVSYGPPCASEWLVYYCLEHKQKLHRCGYMCVVCDCVSCEPML